MGSKSDQAPVTHLLSLLFRTEGLFPRSKAQAIIYAKGQREWRIHLHPGKNAWRQTLSIYLIKGTGVSCYPAHPGEMLTFLVNVSSPLSSRENTLSCWYYSIQWIIQFSYQLHYSICLPKSLPLSHPHISNSRHPLFCREQSLVLCYTPGTNPGAQDTDLSPDNPSHHPHPPGHLCNLLDLSQILPHLRFPTALNHAPYITSELGQFLNSSPNNSLPELGHLTPLTRVFFG